MDIIILIFLLIHIGRLAKRKGQSALKWRFNLAIGWILAELLGLVLGIAFFGRDNPVSWLILAAGFAGTFYYIIKNYLNKLPDIIDEEDINNFGR